MASEKPSPRRRRDPESTRAAILDAATAMLAQDGAEGLSVSGVAKLAGVNRGTAYQHFPDRDELVRATLDRVSEQLLTSVFGDGGGQSVIPVVDTPLDLVHLPDMINGMAEFNLRLAEFAIEQPDIGRVWLYDVLSREDPNNDPFYQRFEQALARFAASDAAEQGIDVEVVAVQMLAGYFLWPVWARAHAKSKRSRRVMARRYAAEMLRHSMHGVFRADSHAVLQAYLKANLKLG